MNKPHAACAFFFRIAVFALTTLFVFNSHIDVRAQQNVSESSDTARGIKLYRQGETIKAIEALTTAVKNRKDDADAWCYLGLALNRGGHAKSARKAFEAAVKLKPDSALAHTGLAYTLLLANKSRNAVSEAERALALNAQNADAHYIISVVRLREYSPSKALQESAAALQLNANFAAALLVQSQALLGLIMEEHARFLTHPTKAMPLSKEAQKEHRIATAKRYKEAADSLEKYLKLSPDTANTNVWREQLETLRIYAETADKPESERTVFSPDEVTSKYQILSKPEPQFTDEAREQGINGDVVLRAILAFDGSVKHILVLQSLSGGLTEQAIKAALKLKFIPASKDGHPVSMVVTLEYGFRIG